MVKISAFADEVSMDFKEQIRFLKENGVGYIELRFVDGKNLMDLNPDELECVKQQLNEASIKVSAIGSPIGKVLITEKFAKHFERFKHAVDLAKYFGAPFIRVFSYYAPENENIDNYRELVLEYMRLKAHFLKGSDIIMVHENEAHIYGHSAKNCADLVRSVNSPNLKLAYDPANFVWGEGIVNNMETCWPLMKNHVVHVHIKDWKLGSEKVGAFPGEGDGQIPELMQALKKMHYSGFITMEPHLEEGGQFGGVTGSKLFSEAIEKTKKLAANMEIDLSIC